MKNKYLVKTKDMISTPDIKEGSGGSLKSEAFRKGFKILAEKSINDLNTTIAPNLLKKLSVSDQNEE
jgi:hypothetical protein